MCVHMCGHGALDLRTGRDLDESGASSVCVWGSARKLAWKVLAAVAQVANVGRAAGAQGIDRGGDMHRFTRSWYWSNRFSDVQTAVSR
jgi:hypothetical protein